MKPHKQTTIVWFPSFTLLKRAYTGFTLNADFDQPRLDGISHSGRAWSRLRLSRRRKRRNCSLPSRVSATRNRLRFHEATPDASKCFARQRAVCSKWTFGWGRTTFSTSPSHFATHLRFRFSHGQKSVAPEQNCLENGPETNNHCTQIKWLVPFVFWVGCRNGSLWKVFTASEKRDYRRERVLWHCLFLPWKSFKSESRHNFNFQSLDGRFLRAFPCPSICVAAFHNSMKVIGLDACHIKARYCGVVLLVTVLDGNGSLFSAAIRIAERENEDTWKWFLLLLRNALHIDNEGEGIVAMSDREKGIENALKEIIPRASHSFCVVHIMKM